MNTNPTDDKYEKIMAQRAEKLARTVQVKAQNNIFSKVAMIRLGHETIGIPIDGIREILKAPSITVLPWMPPWIMGIIQVRGELISVVDLSFWFKIKTTPKTPSSEGFLVVVDATGPLSLFADAVLGFREVLAGEIAESFSISESGRRNYIKAVTKELTFILDLTEFLKDERLIINHSRKKKGAMGD
jgi:purine-binding chemotaxis protein CheW